jgi:hypothetical protein
LILCVSIAGITYAGGDRKSKPQKSGKKSSQKKERAPRKESGSSATKTNRATETKRVTKPVAPRPAPQTKRPKETKRTAPPARTAPQKREKRPAAGHIDRTRRPTLPRPQDRTVREKQDIRGYRERDRGERDRKKKKKKDNPGSVKDGKRDGKDARIKIPPRDGRYRPPPVVPGRPPRPWPPPPPPFPPEPEIYYTPVVREYYAESEYQIPLPAGVIEPDEIEPAFIEKIDYIRSIGRGDSLLVCLFQTYDPLLEEDITYLFDRGVTFYDFLTKNTALIDVSVENIFLLVMDLPSFRWIGEYIPEYKYRHEPPESSRRGAYVYSLAGDSHDFRVDLKHIGIRVVDYFEETGDYYVIADWDRFPEIAEFWWVEKVYKESESFSEVYLKD